MSYASRVICVLFDAANRDVTFSSKTKTSTLKSLRREGIFVYSKTVLPSNSLCARHAAFSGSYPSVSGILSGKPTENIFDVALNYGFPTIVSGGWFGDKPSLNIRGSVSIFNAPKPDTIGRMFLVGERRGEFTSRFVVELACRFMDEKPKFKILFVDFLDSDCVGHYFKESSEEYRLALEYEDRQLRQLMLEVQSRGLSDGTLWIIFTDHSMSNGRHGSVETIDSWILLYGDPLPEHVKGEESIGTILDICPTICNALNIRVPHRCRATSILERMDIIGTPPTTESHSQ